MLWSSQTNSVHYIPYSLYWVLVSLTKFSWDSSANCKFHENFGFCGNDNNRYTQKYQSGEFRVIGILDEVLSEIAPVKVSKTGYKAKNIGWWSRDRIRSGINMWKT